MKLLFFIESLCSGGKERRLVELLIFLKQNTNYELSLVLTEETIHYTYIKDLQIPIHIIKRKYVKYDPFLFFRFYRIAKNFNPDIIHTWGVMTTWYAIPTKIKLKKQLIANLIADAKKDYNYFSLKNLFFKTTVKYADLILGNSMAGFSAYNLNNNPKIKLIYNGVRLDRFASETNSLKIKQDIGIKSPYIVIMVASVSIRKDYDLLLDVAKEIAASRQDICFVGVGDGSEFERLQARINNENIKNAKLLGKRNDVEKLITTADIGVLFTNANTHAEGISNSIIEYMALGKPVLTTDCVGGSKEIIDDLESGFIMQRNVEEITEKILNLIKNPELRKEMGERGRGIIYQKFTIDRMGKEYVELYEGFKKG